ncbi:hypothetical protein DRO69_00495 [Candidatus Bathyarchaeota archaeon]|nr:MAG: hypothetical protein DRO69_00495 [Candidatus Bathyarchaeota archaeon]
MRSQRARSVDERREAKLAKTVEEWMRNPSRRDLKQVDYPKEKARKGMLLRPLKLDVSVPEWSSGVFLYGSRAHPVKESKNGLYYYHLDWRSMKTNMSLEGDWVYDKKTGKIYAVEHEPIKKLGKKGFSFWRVTAPRGEDVEINGETYVIAGSTEKEVILWRKGKFYTIDPEKLQKIMKK